MDCTKKKHNNWSSEQIQITGKKDYVFDPHYQNLNHECVFRIVPVFKRNEKYTAKDKNSGVPRNQSRSATIIFYKKIWHVVPTSSTYQEKKN